MPTERLSMRKTREILRLKLQQQRSHREIAAALGVGVGTPSKIGVAAQRAGLASWDDVAALNDDELDARIYMNVSPKVARPMPDLAKIDIELRREGVTLRLLHEEYSTSHPNGYGYTKFVALYNAWTVRTKLTMRQVHKAGEKIFVDYAGKRPSIVDGTTGEKIEVELFVAVLGASNFTFAEATATQRSHDWLSSHVRMLDFLGGVPRVVVPDQLKSGVTTASRYEPGIQRTYEEWSQHYDTTILPARPLKPRDKAKVEVGVQIAERWILARLRNVTCFSLGELNEQIAVLLADLNQRVMKRYGKSRQELFDELDRPALAPLPSKRFVHGTWSGAKVGYDYHVTADHHDYSVPHALVDENVDIRMAAATIEIFQRSKLVATHVRSFERGGTTTNPEHMPAAHQKYADESIADFEAWAVLIGPCTAALVHAMLTERRHPEHGFRSYRGIKSLTKRYSPDRIEAACERALVIGARTFTNVESILRHGLDKLPVPNLTPSEEEPPLLDHENIRGPDYYH